MERQTRVGVLGQQRVTNNSKRASAERAALTRITARSEIARIAALNALLLVIAAFGLLRWLLVPEATHVSPRWIVVLVPLFAIGMAGVAQLRRIERQGRAIPRWMWASNVVFESLLPTVFIAALYLSGTMPARDALTSPALLAYAIVLVMSPLRLRPMACVAQGLISGVSHGGLVAISGAAHVAGPMGGPASLMYGYAGWIFMTGLAAGFVARQLRAHVENVLTETSARERAEREICVAAEIQRGLLPATEPEIPGFRLAFWNRPADETGGDYYDWQPLPDGRFAVSLADVSGHGLGPALMAAFCRAYARAAFDGRRGVCDAVRQVNALLSADLPPGRFVTFAVAVITPGVPEVEILSAGHGPILVHRAATGVAETHDANAVPLGVDADEPFDGTGCVRLAPGDGIVLVTDGFFEWRRGAGDFFGIERLKETILRAPADPAKTITAMRRDVESFADGSPQTDDLTAVVIRYAG